jgi:hypothetical protein
MPEFAIILAVPGDFMDLAPTKDFADAGGDFFSGNCLNFAALDFYRHIKMSKSQPNDYLTEASRLTPSFVLRAYMRPLLMLA